MSDFDNQYKSPETQIVPEGKQVAGNLTETMLKHLKEASPWCRFIGILGFVGSGFMAVSGFFLLVASVAASSFFSEFGNIPFWILSLIYIAGAVILLFPSLFTFRYGDRIRKYQYSNSDEDMEEAFKNNKSLWKFTGIMYIIYLAFIPVTIVVSLIIGVIAAVNYL